MGERHNLLYNVRMVRAVKAVLLKKIVKTLLVSVLGFVLVLLALWYALYLLANPLSLSGGVFTDKTISPGGRWEVRFYFIAADTLGEDHYRAEAKDRTGEYPVRNIYDDEGSFQPVKWLDSNHISIHQHEIDLRGGSYRAPFL